MLFVVGLLFVVGCWFVVLVRCLCFVGLFCIFVIFLYFLVVGGRVEWLVDKIVRVVIRNDHTTMTAPLPVCSAKLSIVGPG